MEVFHAVLVVGGLSSFEGVSRLDNAIINVEVLRTMGQKAHVPTAAAWWAGIA